MPAKRSTAAPPRPRLCRPSRRPPSSAKCHCRRVGLGRSATMAERMAHIVLLALAAAVFPTLIACVAIMISRPEPRRLLLAFYTGGVLASVGAGIVVLNAFNRGDSVIGNSSSNPNPVTSIVAGLLALALGWLMVSDRGRALLNRWRRHHPRRHAKEDGPSWAERRLDQANVAVAV